MATKKKNSSVEKTAPKSAPAPSPAPAARRLYRSESDRMLGGVAGGIAHYFNVDSTLIRLIFVILLFAGPGLPIYLVLWLVVPSEHQSGDDPVRANTEDMRKTAEGYAKNMRKDNRSVWGIFLVGLGALWLLANFGFFRVFDFERFWPLILIIIGFLMLVRR